jgi:hypothetical protein
VACAAYRHGKRIEDERQMKTHDYTLKGGILAEGIALPEGAPDWMLDIGKLTNAIERREDRSTRRKEAQLVREYVIALPHELDNRQREHLLTTIIEEGAVSKGMVAMWAIHEPDRSGDNRNHHAHVMLTMRQIDRSDKDGFGDKARDWNSKKAMELFKGVVEREINNTLEREGIEEKISFTMGEGREATRHLGHDASELERKGIRTIMGDANRAIKARNAEREQARELELGLEHGRALDKTTLERENETKEKTIDPPSLSFDMDMEVRIKRNRKLRLKEMEIPRQRGHERER